METLSRRINSTLGSLAGFKNNLKHGKSLSSIITPVGNSQSQPSEDDKMEFSARLGHNRTASGTSSLGTTTSRSISMNSISSDGSADSPLVEQEDIIALTHHVRSFKDALGKLRRIFHPDRDKQETVRVAAHEKLGDVLRILRSILEKYIPLQSTDLLMAAGQLINQVKTYNFEDEKANPTEFFDSIDQLALAFSSRVSEYLMGDLDTSSAVHPAARTRSCENLPCEGDGSDTASGNSKFPEILSPQQIDEALLKLEDGVSLALQRTKVWSKYAKDVMLYVERRANLEAEYARNVAKLGHAMLPVLKEETCLPFQAIYCSAIDQDIDNANSCNATYNLLQGHKFIEPLTSRRNEHEKTRKQIKETWQRELKKMQDSVNNLRKARTLYCQRWQEYEKAKESLQKAENSEGNEASKLDKKKKIEDDALQKALEAETTYKACVAEANERHQILQKVKAEVLKQVRELILQCDQTMKAVTVCYFQLQHTVSAPAPVKFQTLCESSRLYEPGNQYMEYVKRHSSPHGGSIPETSPYVFEPYSSNDNRLQDKDKKINGSIEGSDESLSHSSVSTRLSDSSRDKFRTAQPIKAWSQSGLPLPGSDSDSISSSQSNKSVDTSPYGSPQIPVRRLPHLSSSDELELDPDTTDSALIPSAGLSKAANTHAFRKLKTPSRCRECDTYLYFQGVECSECGLACHKKCAEILAIQCGHKRLPPKMTTFGVDLALHVQETKSDVPPLVSKCIAEIESRGILIKGIYRMSGVKSKVEKLCQSFENGANLVDLTDIHPNVIANVLKLYLRQLPEPLLTYRLYPDFILLAKKYCARGNEHTNNETLIAELNQILQRLPKSHFLTLATLMHHLKKASENANINNMPASNLGIVFGPTLLRTSEGSASLSSLVDTVYQTRIIELLILLSDELFGSSSNAKSSTMKLPLSRSQSCGVHPKNHDPSLVVGQHNNHSNQQANSTAFHLPGYLGSEINSLEEGTHSSDDDLPDSFLPDDSVPKKSPLLPRNLELLGNTLHDDANLKLRKSLSDGGPLLKNSSNHSDSSGVSVQTELSCFRNVTTTKSYLNNDAPVPPPRRNSPHHKSARNSPTVPEYENVLSQVVPSDKIVIHVQSAAEVKTSSSFEASRTVTQANHSSPVLQGKDLERDEHVTVLSTVPNQTESKEVFNSRKVSETKTSNLVLSEVVSLHDTQESNKKNCHETSEGSKPLVRTCYTKPYDSKVAKNVETVENCRQNHQMESKKMLENNVEVHSALESNLVSEYADGFLAQQSPVSSGPSTNSSLDELDGVSCLQSSPVLCEYVSPYKSRDPYKPIRLGTGSPLLYSQTTTFANYDEPFKMKMPSVHLSQNDCCLSTEMENSHQVLRTSIAKMGIQSNLLTVSNKCHSPSCSTSTKSSGSSSPAPDHECDDTEMLPTAMDILEPMTNFHKSNLVKKPELENHCGTEESRNQNHKSADREPCFV